MRALIVAAVLLAAGFPACALRADGALRASRAAKHRRQPSLDDIDPLDDLENATAAAKEKAVDALDDIEPLDDLENATGKAAERAQDVEEEWGHSWDRLQEGLHDLPETAEQSSARTFEAFMPKLNKTWHRGLTTATIIILISIIWFVVYFRYIFEDDSREDLTRWVKAPQDSAQATPTSADPVTPNFESHTTAENLEHATNLEINADVILIFHNPEYDHKDHKDIPSEKALQRVEVKNLRSSKDYFQNVHALREKVRSSSKGSSHSRDHSPERGPTMRDLRIAYLKDIFATLQGKGFDVQVYRSVELDHLLVYVRLTPEAEVHRINIEELKLKIQQVIASKINVKQPPGPTSSSPFMPFDPSIVSSLHAAGVLRHDDPHLFYRMRGKYLLSGMERIRMIYRLLSKFIDLDALKEEKLIRDWYPVHSKVWLKKLRIVWANWSFLRDLSFVQPASCLEGYFGTRVAFILAWNGFYCKALLCLVPIALVIAFCSRQSPVQWMVFWMWGVHDEIQLLYGLIASFSIVLICWSRIARNLWLRQQRFFLTLWNVETTEKTIRPRYVGDLLPSIADENITEKQYSPVLSFFRKLLSSLATLAFCALVAFCITVWYGIFTRSMNFEASLFLFIQIQFFQAMFKMLAPLLTEFENHKYQTNYYNSYLWKQFLFQSVNQFLPFFYMIFHNTTLGDLRLQLMLTQFLLVITSILTIAWSSIYMQISLALQVHRIKKNLGEEGEVKRSFEEEQSKKSEFRIMQQIDVMTQLMLSLGFVLLFGGISPAIVILSLAVFMVQVRGSAYALVETMRRPMPRSGSGIGSWQTIIDTLMVCGVIFSACLTVVHASEFEGTPLVTRLSGIIFFCILMFFFWGVIDLFFPPTSTAATILNLRRDRVEKEILRICEERNVERKSRSPIRTSKDLESSVVEREMWSEIPTIPVPC